ncbi:MAG: CxxxxCH/CxxCH domain-containing protein [Ignavibacteriaceae bacterium]
MKKVFLILSVTILGFYLTGCSDLQTEITQPSTLLYHKEGINKSGSPDFHGKVIRMAGWQTESCQSCHGNHYDGGTVEKSCVSCHTNPAGPEACNTCHGVFTEPIRTAPPRDLSNNFQSTASGVGAHAAHLYENMSGLKLECNECHTIPATLKSAGHIDADGKAEIVWGDLAKLRLDGVDSTVMPVYDFAANTCANTYCHGYFEYGNLTNVVKWTDKAECGTCHGDPATGNPIPNDGKHTKPYWEECQTCHKSGQKVNGVFSIKESEKNYHVNGKVDIK